MILLGLLASNACFVGQIHSHIGSSACLIG
jgi:hypothetical protein